jgi:predicted CoA-binding protein
VSDDHLATTPASVREHARDVLARSRTVAVVGFSATPGKAAHDAPMELVRRGFDVIPVNPRVEEIAGLRTVPDLASIDRPVDLVDVFRPAPETPDVARQAVAIGAKALWLQLGITSGEAREIAEDGGLDYVEDQCVAPISRAYDLHPPA